MRNDPEDNNLYIADPETKTYLMISRKISSFWNGICLYHEESLNKFINQKNAPADDKQINWFFFTKKSKNANKIFSEYEDFLPIYLKEKRRDEDITSRKMWGS